jgi:hypothetical protein
MKKVIAATFGLLSLLPLVAQGKPPGVQQTPQTVPPPTSSTSQASRISQTATASVDDEKIRELTHRIQKLELEVIQKSKPQDNSIAITTAMIAASAVFGAALLGMFGQYLTAKREERRAVATAQQATELARLEAIYKHTEKILDFRLKQMEQFYAPMFALLGQSKGLYDKMRLQLAQDEPSRYRLNPEKNSTDEFQVLAKDGTWKSFRLLDQLPAVRSDPKAFALAEGILEIGEKMTTIISEHAGLASESLIDLLGQYMAHYATLHTIYKRGETEAYEPGWHKVRYYPRELNAQVESGYRELSAFIDEYVEASKKMLKAMPVIPGTPAS